MCRLVEERSILARKKSESTNTKQAFEWTYRKGHGPLGEYGPGIDYAEVVPVVCRYLFQGLSPSRIVELMEERYGIKMTREVPYKMLHYAIGRGLIKFVEPPAEDHLGRKLRDKYLWLKDIEVVQSIDLIDVTYRAALMLMKILRNFYLPPYSKNEVHIGFSGGYATWKVVEKLAELLKESAGELPSTVVFHALGATAFDIEMSLSQFRVFTINTNIIDSERETPIKIQFVDFPAPPIIHPEQKSDFLQLPILKDAAEQITNLDIILNSASSIEDAHSILHKNYYNTEQLIRDGCVGDMLWLPLSHSGPIEQSRENGYEYRPMTLIELNDLPKYIEQGTKVLLVLGPCGGCNTPKADILDAILNLKEHFITHLVVDSSTVKCLFEHEHAITS
jgi:DNA-binding transcriptional regulator LsrR (DeoR family)